MPSQNASQPVYVPEQYDKSESMMRFHAAHEAPMQATYFSHGPLAYANSYESHTPFAAQRPYASQENHQVIYTPPTPESEAESAENFREVPPSHNVPLPITTVTNTQLKLNRRNNPELERRRVHFCDSPGCTKGETFAHHQYLLTTTCIPQLTRRVLI